MVVVCNNNPELASIVKSDIDNRINGSLHINTTEAINNARFYHVGFLKHLEYIFLKLPSNWFDYLL